MSSARLTLLLPVISLPVLAGQPEPPRAKTEAPSSSSDAPPLIKLAPQATVPPSPALRYNLLPRRRDLQPGNAAPLWIQAGQVARDVNKKIDHDWTQASAAALKDLPKKEVRAVLEGYASALRLAEQASRRERCDWEIPPFRLGNWDFPYAELQGFRELAQVLSVRCRLELSDGDFDRAAQTLQTGFTLARHVGDSDTLIQALVGIAIAEVMFSHVEAWMQVPGSPNLYWSLTALPVPLIDVRRAIEVEFGHFDQAFPQLRKAREGALEPAQVDALIAGLTASFGHRDSPPPDWQVRLAMSLVVTKAYPDARRSLLAAGYKAERIEAMSPVQVVVVHYLVQNDQFRDDVVKLLTLPPWQGLARMEEVSQEVRRLKQELANPLLALLFPSVHKTYESRVRLERTAAVLRCAESLRLYAAGSAGRAPSKLADVVAVPLPIDPLTGKGFDALYSIRDGRGVLDVPGMLPKATYLGRRYDAGPSR
jgi:hypothetical protein